MIVPLALAAVVRRSFLIRCLQWDGVADVKGTNLLAVSPERSADRGAM
jgi:hypothetical protein